MKYKLKAAGIHLLCSAVVAASALILVYFFWYPDLLAKAMGVSHIFLLLLSIDLVLGPLLTFVIYKRGKKTLFFDMSVILLLQFAAFCYGMFTIYEGRPIWLVYNVDRVDAIAHPDLDIRHIDEAKPEYQSPSFFSPQWVAASPPQDGKSNEDIVFDAVFAGIDIPQRPELYHPFKTAKQDILNRALELDKLREFNDDKLVDDMLKQYPQADSYIPLKANAVDMTILTNKQADGDNVVVAVVDLRPWK